MKLSPLDIRKQEFGGQIKGFDKEEVKSFLTMIADEFEQLLSQQQELQKTIENQSTKLSEYKAKEKSLQDALVSAERTSRAKTEEIDKQAETKIQKAEFEAEQIISNARRKHQQILDDVTTLESQRRTYLLSVSNLLRGQIQLLDLLEKESVDSIIVPPGQKLREPAVARDQLITELRRLDRERKAFLKKMKRIHISQMELLEILEEESPRKKTQ